MSRETSQDIGIALIVLGVCLLALFSYVICHQIDSLGRQVADLQQRVIRLEHGK